MGLDRDAPEVVALGEDPGDHAVAGNDERPDVLLEHLLDRGEDGLGLLDHQHDVALLREDVSDAGHRVGTSRELRDCLPVVPVGGAPSA